MSLRSWVNFIPLHRDLHRVSSIPGEERVSTNSSDYRLNTEEHKSLEASAYLGHRAVFGTVCYHRSTGPLDWQMMSNIFLVLLFFGFLLCFGFFLVCLCSDNLQAWHSRPTHWGWLHWMRSIRDSEYDLCLLTILLSSPRPGAAPVTGLSSPDSANAESGGAEEHNRVPYAAARSTWLLGLNVAMS